MDFEFLSWADIENHMIDLSSKIYLKRLNFNTIFYIWRVGAFPLRLSSDFLNINTIFSMNIQYYDAIQKKRNTNYNTTDLDKTYKKKYIVM